jgi:hypothetical protein
MTRAAQPVIRLVEKQPGSPDECTHPTPPPEDHPPDAQIPPARPAQTGASRRHGGAGCPPCSARFRCGDCGRIQMPRAAGWGLRMAILEVRACLPETPSYMSTPDGIFQACEPRPDSSPRCRRPLWCPRVRSSRPRISRRRAQIRSDGLDPAPRGRSSSARGIVREARSQRGS